MSVVNERHWMESAGRVRHPLEAVRKYIRTYVVLEGLGIAVLYLAGMLWIGLALDWGSFRLFAFDWVQELQQLTDAQGGGFGLRVALLAILLVGLLAVVLTKVVFRLAREFSDTSVALLLERRFPRELGDRLITAVELADPGLAEKYGYSAPLVEKTIAEAAERVERLPVTDVFDWARLRRIFWLCGLATLGLYVLVGIVVCSVGAATGGSASPLDFVADSADIGTIFVERNVLLMDTYWPRKAYLEVLGFSGSEMRVGRDEQRSDFQVRASRWVIADRGVRGGWRPLRWQDLDRFFDSSELAKVDIAASWPGWIIDTDDVEDSQGSIPPGLVPASWQAKTSGEIRNELRSPSMQSTFAQPAARQAIENLLDWRTWTIDRLALQLARPAVRAQLRQDHVSAVFELEALLTRLEELGQSSGMSRELRQLEVPDQVTVYVRGKTIKNDQAYPLQSDNKYTIAMNDAKESFRFTVRGKDYYTPYKDIVLVPPPAITSLVVDKEEPAYAHVRVQGDQSALKGKKQIFKAHPVSVTGEASIVQVPIGTNLILRADIEPNRPLKEGVRVVAPDKFAETGAVVPEARVQLESPSRFSLKINHVRKTHEFDLEFFDQDNVKGRRRVLIRPIDDRPPELFDVELEVVLRKPRFKQDPAKTSQGAAPEGYLITPDASLPIKGTVQDDYGLTRVQWLFEVEQIELELMGDVAPSKGKTHLMLRGNPAVRRATLLASALQMNPGRPGLELLAAPYWKLVGQLVLTDIALKRQEGERTAALKTFLLRREEKSGDEVPLAAVDAVLLQKVEGREPFRKISWKDSDGFDLKEHLPQLKSSDPQNQAQLHYQVRLALAATDNNVETGPSTSRNKVPFSFLIVSENELLAQIGIEEEVLSERLEKVYEKLKNAKTTLSEQLGKLSLDEPKYEPIAVRVDEVRKALGDGGTSTREVFADYTRIQRELEVNRVHLEKVLRVQNEIVSPLGKLFDPKEGDFPLAEQAVQTLHEGLEADIALLSQKATAKPTLPQRLDETRLARDRVDQLMTKVNDILVVMQKEVTFAKALEQAIYLERIQRQTAERLMRLHLERERELLDSLFKK